MCFGSEDKRLNYLKSWCVFFAIGSLLTIYRSPDPNMPGDKGGIQWASVGGLLLAIAPFVAKEKSHFQGVCVLYGTCGAIKIIMGTMLLVAVAALAGMVAGAGGGGKGSQQEQQQQQQAAHSMGGIILLIGLLPVFGLCCSAMCSCCASHYSHQVATYLGTEGQSLDDLKNNTAKDEVKAREPLLDVDGEGGEYEKIV
jgi:hypothetical protein